MSKAENYKIGKHLKNATCKVLLWQNYESFTNCVNLQLPCSECAIGKAYTNNNKLSPQELINAHSEAIKTQPTQET